MAGFAVGDRVRVARRFPPTPPAHLRTPWYCRGKTGVVERVCGAFRDPEALAFGRDGLPKLVLYRVRFAQHELWPDYAGPAGDHVEIELYESWLEPTGAAVGRDG